MAISTMESWYASQNAANWICLLRSGDFLYLPTMKCSFTLERAPKATGRISYRHQTWQRTTQISLSKYHQLQSLSSIERIGAIENRRGAVEMTIIIVSVIICKYYTWITQLFSIYFDKQFIKINMVADAVSSVSKHSLDECFLELLNEELCPLKS